MSLGESGQGLGSGIRPGTLEIKDEAQGKYPFEEWEFSKPEASPATVKVNRALIAPAVTTSTLTTGTIATGTLSLSTLALASLTVSTLVGGAVSATTLVATPRVFYAEDQKAAGEDGGTFTAGAWRTRDLNTVVLNTITGASLASNQVTLPAGTYWIEASAPGNDTGGHVTQLYNITNSAVLLTGTAEYNSSSSTGYAVNTSRIQGLITLTGTKVIEVQHRCHVTSSGTYGMGTCADVGQAHNTYTTFKATKLA